MSKAVIQVDSISKKFCRRLRRSMYYGGVDILRSGLNLPVHRDILREDEFWAVNDVSFKINQGETLGVIGTNGSGKSTLLRLIYGIYRPDRGSISVTGKIGALIAVGAGFHPHMTGRENIFLNGTILGMSREEIQKKLDSIVDFADLDNFIDAPVSTYSSGMVVRLGFSISIHSHPEILIADEILAVGDLSFALKCYRKIAEYQRNGGTILLVSHGMQLIRNTCRDTLWLDKGKMRMLGPSNEVCNAYENFIMEKDRVLTSSNQLGTRINYDKTAQVKNVVFRSRSGELLNEAPADQPFDVEIEFDFKRLVKKPLFTFGLLNSESILVFASYSDVEQYASGLNAGTGTIKLRIPALNIKPGNYYCTVTLTEENYIDVLDWHEKAYVLTIKPTDVLDKGGLLCLKSSWTEPEYA